MGIYGGFQNAGKMLGEELGKDAWGQTGKLLTKGKKCWENATCFVFFFMSRLDS